MTETLRDVPLGLISLGKKLQDDLKLDLKIHTKSWKAKISMDGIQNV